LDEREKSVWPAIAGELGALYSFREFTKAITDPTCDAARQRARSRTDKDTGAKECSHSAAHHGTPSSPGRDGTPKPTTGDEGEFSLRQFADIRDVLIAHELLPRLERSSLALV
jgi:hypothetical protein